MRRVDFFRPGATTAGRRSLRGDRRRARLSTSHLTEDRAPRRSPTTCPGAVARTVKIPTSTDQGHSLGKLLEAERARSVLRRRVRNGRGGAGDIRSFLAHAARSVPFYRDLRLGSDAPASPPLSEFPLVGRREIAADAARFVSTAFDPSHLTWATTSGTSGVPLRVPRDPASAYHYAYDVFRWIRPYLSGFDAALRPGELAVVALNDNPQRHRFTFINPSIEYGIVDRLVMAGDPPVDQALVKSLRGRVIPLLTARPRCLVRLVDVDAELAGDSGTVAAGAILSSGDNLHQTERRRIEEHFRCRVHDAYASQEAGLVAVECGHGTGMHVLPHALCEARADDGAMSREGAGELVVTSASNWALPVIRYRTGDHAEVRTASCACGHSGPSIVKMTGRESTWFEVGGRLLNPSVLNSVFEALPIAQFQVTQRGDEVSVSWVADRGAVEEDVRAALARGLSGALPGKLLSIRRVESIGRRDQKVQRYIRETA